MTLRPKTTVYTADRRGRQRRANQFDRGEGATRTEISRSRLRPSGPSHRRDAPAACSTRPEAKRSFRPCEAQQPPRGAVGEEPQRAVRSLPHVANALAQLPQQALFPEHLVAVELEPQQ